MSGLLLRLYERMWLIRAFEETVSRARESGELPGLVHLSIGSEAVAVGVVAELAADDRLYSSHRAHGHFLAAGVDPVSLMAELAGRETGLCRGRAGSMHLVSRRAVMATGVVGGTIPIAVGHAMALRAPAVAVVFFGDGAVQTGVFHEALNLAALWRAPVLFVLENNMMVEFSAIEEHTAVGDLSAHAAVHGMPCERVDGSDVEAVRSAAAQLLEGVRRRAGPAFLECRISRLRPHYEGDLRRPTGGDDPVVRARERLLAAATPSEDLDRVAEAARRAAEAALEDALRAPLPRPEDDAPLVFSRPLP